MRGTGMLLRCAVTGVTLVAAGLAPAAAEEVAKTAPMFEKLTGKIVSVDPERRVLTLDREPGPNMTTQREGFYVAQETLISKDGVPLKFDDLQIGPDVVTVEYLVEEGKQVAKSITIARQAVEQAAGTIDAVDLRKGELLVKPEGVLNGSKAKAFTMDERTVVSRNGVRSHATDLLRGERVRVAYTMIGDRAIARSIMLQQ